MPSKAIVHDRYRVPDDVLRLYDISVPTIGDDRYADTRKEEARAATGSWPLPIRAVDP